MKVLGVIPARYGSQRFPGKPLAKIAGKPLLQWVIEASRTSLKIDEVIVATDDERIAILAKSCGVAAVMTDSSLPSGTDRVWAAIKNKEFDLAINIQGDEPLLKGEILDCLVESMVDNPECEMATLGHRFVNKDDISNPNTVKIVLNKNNEAIYFSRFPIPYSRSKDLSETANLQHVGLYGYTKSFIELFCNTPAQELELAEGLEQLRALYLGAKIRVTEVSYKTRGVDSPEDIELVEKELLTR